MPPARAGTARSAYLSVTDHGTIDQQSDADRHVGQPAVSSGAGECGLGVPRHKIRACAAREECAIGRDKFALHMHGGTADGIRQLQPDKRQPTAVVDSELAFADDDGRTIIGGLKG